MPEVVTCPKCQTKSRVPGTLVGKRVKCPKCAEVFAAVVDAPPPPARKEEEREEGDTYDVVREKKRRRDDDDERVSDQRRSRRRDDEDEDDDRVSTRRRGRDDDEDDDDERVTRRRRSRADDDDDDDEDDDDRPRRRRPRIRADWASIHRGLTLILTSVIGQIIFGIMLGILAVAVVGSAVQAVGRGAGGGAVVGVGAGVVVIGILAVVGSLVLLALRVAGHYFCLPSPDAYSSKGLAMATLVLMLAQVGCMVLDWIITVIVLGSAGLGALANPMAFGGAPNALSTIVNLIAGLAGFALFFVFLFYLRSLALVTGNAGLARTIITYMITAVAGTVLFIAMFCVGVAIMAAGAAKAAADARPGVGDPFAGVAAMGALGVVCMCVGGLFFLGMFIWWIVILVQTRGAVASRLRRA